MVDLLPAGVISHGLYGGSKWVQNQPTGQTNAWGVQRPGAPLTFTYQSAMVGAGYIACEGKRVCGATMTSDGFGRWSVPSARDMADVFNMIMANNYSYAQYFDMTADRIFERVNLLSAELHRLSLAVSRGGAAPTGNGPAAAASERPMSARENVPVVQGQVVEAEAKPMGTWQPLPKAASASVAVRENSGPCVNATNPGGWEPMKVPSQPPVPRPPFQRPQTASSRPVPMACRTQPPTAGTPGTTPGTVPWTPGAMPQAPRPDPGDAASWAAEMNKFAAQQPWMAGRRQLPGGGR